MEPIELGIFVASLALIILSVAFYKFNKKIGIEGRKIVWMTYLPLENHKIEEICVLLFLDYEKIVRMKDDYVEKKKNFEVDDNLSFLGNYSEIKSMKEADNLLSALNEKENLFFKLFMTASSLLTFTIFFLGFTAIKG